MLTLSPEETVQANKALSDMTSKCSNAIDSIHGGGLEAWSHEFPTDLEGSLIARRSAAQGIAERMNDMRTAAGEEPITLTKKDSIVLSDILRELVDDCESELERELASGPEAGNFDYCEILEDRLATLKNFHLRIQAAS